MEKKGEERKCSLKLMNSREAAKDFAAHGVSRG